MPLFRRKSTGDVVTAEGPNADRLSKDDRWEQITPATAAKDAETKAPRATG